jgi:hypothetical protein
MKPLLDRLRSQAKALPEDGKGPSPLSQEAIAEDRQRRAEIASQAIQDICNLWRVELIAQVTITGQAVTSTVLCQARE